MPYILTSLPVERKKEALLQSQVSRYARSETTGGPKRSSLTIRESETRSGHMSASVRCRRYFNDFFLLCSHSDLDLEQRPAGFGSDQSTAMPVYDPRPWRHPKDITKADSCNSINGFSVREGKSSDSSLVHGHVFVGAPPTD